MVELYKAIKEHTRTIEELQMYSNTRIVELEKRICEVDCKILEHNTSSKKTDISLLVDLKVALSAELDKELETVQLVIKDKKDKDKEDINWFAWKFFNCIFFLIAIMFSMLYCGIGNYDSLIAMMISNGVFILSLITFGLLRFIYYLPIKYKE